MHVPGFIQDRKQAAVTSPAMFTVNCFGPAEAVVQVTADRLSLFPMEGDWDSAKCAVADGLWPEEVSASLLDGMIRVWNRRYEPLLCNFVQYY